MLQLCCGQALRHRESTGALTERSSSQNRSSCNHRVWMLAWPSVSKAHARSRVVSGKCKCHRMKISKLAYCFRWTMSRLEETRAAARGPIIAPGGFVVVVVVDGSQAASWQRSAGARLGTLDSQRSSALVELIGAKFSRAESEPIEFVVLANWGTCCVCLCTMTRPENGPQAAWDGLSSLSLDV